MTDQILVDNREHRLIKLMKAMGYPIDVQMLEIGDIILGKSVIEIKRIEFNEGETRISNDVWASILDNRADTQAQDRRDNFEWSGLIIQVPLGTPILNKEFTQEKWESFKLTMQWDFKTHLFITRSDEETIELLRRIWEKEQKGPKVVSPCNKTPKSKDVNNPITLKNQRMYLLSGLLDVGDKAAEELLSHFGDPLHVFDWICTTKIGLTPKSKKLCLIEETLAGYGLTFFMKNKKLFGCELIEEPRRENND